MRPSFARSIPSERGRGECRMPAAPAASRAMCRKHTSKSPQVHQIHPAFPHAMVLRLIPCSPRRRIRLVTVIGGLRFCRTRSGRLHLRRLDTSNGCQDHTASPSATIAVRLRAPIAHGPKGPALQSRPRADAAASTASRPASVTIAIRPSWGRDGESSKADLGQAGTEIFLKMGLDRKTARRANQPGMRDPVLRRPCGSEFSNAYF
jgi:hypothetical protein